MRKGRNLAYLAVALLIASFLAGFIIHAAVTGGDQNAGETSEITQEATGSASNSPTEEDVSEKEVGEPPPYQVFNVEVVMDYIKHLSVNIGYRPGGTDAERKAAVYIKEAFSSIGYSQVYEQVFTLDNGLTSSNIYVIDRGSDPNNVIIVGGHYDSAGGTSSPGANDNGSGVATVLELARIFRVDDNLPTLVFAAFGSEEVLQGYGKNNHHYGSRYMANHLLEIPGNVVGMISIDMVAVGSQILLNSTLKAPRTFADMFAAYAGRKNIFTQFRNDPGWSDHEAFEGHGVSSFWVEYREDPYYHSPQDTFDKIQPGLISQIGSLMQGFLEDLSAADIQALDAASNYR